MRPRRAPPQLGLVALVLAGGPACGATSAEDPRPPDPARELVAERAELRAWTSTLLVTAADSLDGKVTTAAGRWRPCAGRFPEGFASYRYVVRARVDPGRDFFYSPMPSVEAALDRAGWSPRRPTVRGVAPEATSLDLVRGDLDVRFYQDAGGSMPWVMLDAGGRCVEVPQRTERGWLDRPDPYADLPVSR